MRLLLLECQAVSSRPDFVPPSYTRELEKLQDRIPPFSDTEALNIIQEELGQPASLVYSDLSPTSIAAASLGQVGSAACSLRLMQSAAGKRRRIH